MNPKNLPLKFAFVALLVALCAWAIATKGIKYGIDLRGGHSLIYQLKDPKAGTATTRDVMDTLKERVDPNGMLSLEWRPLEAGRFEVRMPAASAEAGIAKNDFLDAVDKIQAGNIAPRDRNQVLHAQGDARQKAIEAITSNPRQRELLAEAAVAYDAVQAAQDAPREQRLAASKVYREKLQALADTNVNVATLRNILALYVSKADAEMMTKSGNRETLDRRRVQYKKQLEQFEKQYTDERAKQIALAAANYERWAESRRGLDDPADLQRIIAKAGVLEFRIAPTTTGGVLTAAEVDQYKQALAESGPEAMRKQSDRFAWMPIHGESEEFDGRGLVTAQFQGKAFLLLYNTADDTLLRSSGDGDWKLADARVDQDQTGRPAVDFQMDARGAKLFARLTADHLKQPMAILLDDEVYSAPVIQSMISERGQITGSFTQQEVTELVKTLNAGSLPAKLNPEPISISTFGASLGDENLQLAKKAGFWSLIVVGSFMLIYYMLAGAVANVTMVMNLLLVIGAMSMFEAVLTMPGLAGVILTIGMAVDANVLIYERIREEQAKGQGIRMALKNGYDRALTAIIDSNVTTLIVCAILFWVGTEEVKGFAITLGLGVAFNIFTAVIMTRWIFQAMLSAGLMKNHLKMLHIIRVPKVDWMGKRWYFWGFSLATLALGIAALFWQGKDIFGIEFSSGTQATIVFKTDALVNGNLPTDGLVEGTFVSSAKSLGFDKLSATTRVERRINRERVANFLRDYDVDNDGKVRSQESQGHGLNQAFFAAADVNKDGFLDSSEIEKLNQSYQVATTETDLDKIRESLRQSFGESLQARIKLAFQTVKGQTVPQLGVQAASDGVTLVDNQLIQSAVAHRTELEDFEGGVLIAVSDVTPAISETEFVQRLREIRTQPDFASGQFNPTEVLGLTPGADGGYTAFAVLVRPVDEQVIPGKGWEQFAGQELQTTALALEREAALTAQTFDAAIAGQTAQRAIVAVVLSWLAIIVYLWARFGQFRWGLAAVVCLMHDSIVVVGLVAVSGWLAHTAFGEALMIGSFKIDLAMIAALLTLIGYSVNDTIVVFDRIRENRGKLAAVSPNVINTSVNQTLGRTIMTGGSVFMVIVIMYVWGGPGLHAFNYALVLGVMFGTYSSMAVAAPLLLGFKEAVLRRVLVQQPEAVKQ